MIPHEQHTIDLINKVNKKLSWNFARLWSYVELSLEIYFITSVSIFKSFVEKRKDDSSKHYFKEIRKLNWSIHK